MTLYARPDAPPAVRAYRPLSVAAVATIVVTTLSTVALSAPPAVTLTVFGLQLFTISLALAPMRAAFHRHPGTLPFRNSEDHDDSVEAFRRLVRVGLIHSAPEVWEQSSVASTQGHYRELEQLHNAVRDLHEQDRKGRLDRLSVVEAEERVRRIAGELKRLP